MLFLRLSRVSQSALAAILSLTLLCAGFAAPSTNACTRVVFLGANGEVITARSRD
jgi:penicillin V acylase-like amidase (Ntn superfamily)